MTKEMTTGQAWFFLIQALTKQKTNKLHADKGLRKTGLNQVEQIKLLWNF